MLPAELVRRALDGEAEAWELVVKTHTRYIVAVAIYHGFGHCAEDIKQDVFRLAFRRLATLRDPTRLRNWLTGIALNVIRGYWAHQRREQQLFEQADIDENKAVDPCPRADDQLSETEQRDELMVLVRSLPARQRQVAMLRHFEDYELHEIAAELGITVNAVKCSLCQALINLRKMVRK
jgi:RNA polymerase sigma-70 factor (ECF subfamily)